MAFEVTSAKRSRLGRLSSFLNGKKRKQALNIQNRPLVGRIIRDAPIEPLRPKSLFQPIETIGPTSNHSTQVGRALRARLVEALRVQFSTQAASEMPPLPKLPTLKPHSRIPRLYPDLPRPAPTCVGAGVGAATAGKIKNPRVSVSRNRGAKLQIPLLLLF